MTDWRERADLMAKALDAAPSCQHSGDSLIVVCGDCLVTDTAALAAEAEAHGRGEKDRDFSLIIGALARANGGQIVLRSADLVAVDGELVATLEPNGDRVFTLKAKTGAGEK